MGSHPYNATSGQDFFEERADLRLLPTHARECLDPLDRLGHGMRRSFPKLGFERDSILLQNTDGLDP